MHQLYHLCLAALATCALPVSTWAQSDYATNYSNGETSYHDARYTRSVTLTSDGQDVLTVPVQTGAGSALYVDQTSQVAQVKAGSTLKVTPNYVGEWMNAYAYIDLDNDKQFSSTVDEANHKAAEGSDLRSFSFYSFSTSTDVTGYNSAGVYMTGDARSSVALPEFQAPTVAGTYRMRVKVDWNSLDPGGATASSPWGSMQSNGGAIVDFTLEVTGDDPAVEGQPTPYEINFANSQDGWTTIDNSTTPGKTWVYNAKGFYDSGSYFPCVTMDPDYAAAYDDWYVSPAIVLKAGTTYDVRTLALKSGSGPEVTLCWGPSATEVSEFTQISALTLYTSVFDSKNETFQVTPDRDGAYYFAFHGTTQQYNPATASLMSFAVQETSTPTPEQPEYQLPYTADFKTAAEGWEAVDNNGDKATWQVYSNTGAAVDANSVNDDYVSPTFTLEAGKSYVVRTAAMGGNTNSAAQLSLLAGLTDGELAVVKANLPVPQLGEVSDETVFTPATSGKYHFALRLVIDEPDVTTSPIYLTSFGVEEQKGGEVVEDQPVFTADFSGSDPANGWTVLDQNNDGTTWQGDEAKSGITYDGTSAAGAASDLLVTPAFDLVEGQDYLVSATFSQQSAFDPDKVAFSYGYAPTAEGLSHTIATADVYAEGGSGTVERTYRFTAAESGQGYVGVNVETADANGQLTLTALTVTPVAKAVPTAVTDLQGVADADAGTVTLTWTNPATDTKGLPIASELKARVYQDGELVATTEALQPGEATTFELKPAAMTGTVTYDVRALLGDQESAGTTVKVDLADVSGTEVVVKSFEGVNSSNASEWTIEDLAGTSAWRYDYSNVFRFDYKNGQKNDNDWLISPAVPLEAGQRYVAKYEIATSRDYAVNIDVTLGDAATSTAQTTVLASYPNLKQNGFGQFATSQFTVASTGDYYFGFHAFMANYSATMRNLVIYRLDKTTGIDTAEAASTVSYDARTAWLSVAAAGSEVTVYDLQGRTAARYAAVNDGVSLAGLPQGAYVVKVAVPGVKAQSVKILK